MCCIKIRPTRSIEPLSLYLKDGKLSLTSSMDNQAECVLVVENQQLKILHQQDDLEVQLPSSCEPGQTADCIRAQAAPDRGEQWLESAAI